VAGRLFANASVVGAGDKDLEPLEEAPSSGCLGPGITDPYFRPHGDARKPSEQSRMQRKSHKPCNCLKSSQGPEPAFVGTLPSTLELGAKNLPLVKLSRPDLPPTLQTCHYVSPVKKFQRCCGCEYLTLLTLSILDKYVKSLFIQ